MVASMLAQLALPHTPSVSAYATGLSMSQNADRRLFLTLVSEIEFFRVMFSAALQTTAMLSK